MRGVSHRPAEPLWAPPGRWDWTVTLSFVGTVLLSVGMPFSDVVFGQTGEQRCAAETARLHRMLGPVAWHVASPCPTPPGSAPVGGLF